MTLFFLTIFGISTKTLTAYGLLAVAFLLVVGAIVIVVLTYRHEKRQEGTVLPDLGLHQDEVDDVEDEPEEEETVFTLEYDKASEDAARSEADAMFNAVVQQASSRREAKEQDQEKKGLFSRFKK